MDGDKSLFNCFKGNPLPGHQAHLCMGEGEMIRFLPRNLSTVKRFAIFAVIAGLSFLVLKNMADAGKLLDEKILRGEERIKEGRPFFCGRDSRFDLVNFAEKNIISLDGDCFFWFPENLRGDLSFETDSAILSYYLHSRRVCFKNDAELTSCRWIVLEKVFYYHLKSRLRGLGLEKNFTTASESKKYLVLRRAGE